MSDIILGNNFKLYYNTDIGNTSPQGIDNVLINELAAFPILSLISETTKFDTYTSEYVSTLLSDQSMEDLSIVVNYIATDLTHIFLDEAALNQTEFQLVLVYNFDTEASQISYGIVNGYISAYSLSGDKDSVVQKNYNFTHSQVIARSMVANARLQLFEGDFGVGSDGINIDQYSPITPTGNSFIKIPSGQSGNPASADMMGIGWTDNNQVCEFAVTKSGSLGIYAKNASTAWTRIYTVSQSDLAYVPMARTVNGHALSGNITLSKSDVGLGNVLNVPSYSKTESDTNLSDAVDTLNNSLTDAVDTLVPKTTTVNGHALSGNVSVTAGDVGLGNVQNVPSYSKTESDTNLSDAVDTLVPKTTTVNGHALSGNVSVTAGDVGLGNVQNVPSYSKTESDATTASLVPKTTTVNGYTLSGNIVLSKSDVNLSNVTDNPQLKIASNLSDLANIATARTNLGLGTAAIVNTGTSGATIPLLNGVNTWGGVQNFDTISVGASRTGSTGIELGSTTTAGLAFIDYHTTGSNIDFDARIIASGGTAGTVGLGNFSILAGSFNTNCPITVIDYGNGIITTSGTSYGVNSYRLSKATGASVYQRWDGDNWYFLISDTTTGSYNGLRPIRINGSTGSVNCDNGIFVPQGFTSSNGRVRAFYDVQSTYVAMTVDGNSKGINFFDSDETLKENIENADGQKALDIIKNLRPVSYKFKDYKYTTTEKDDNGNDVEVEQVQKGGEHQYGVIAQEFEKLLPEGVITHPDGKKALDPLEVLGLLLTTCHEQQKLIKQLQTDVEELKNK